MKYILLIIFTHFIADFLCQTDKMALNKSKSIYWLSVHVLTYTAILSVASFIIFQEGGIKPVIVYALLNGGLHWVTDFFTSRLTAYLWQKEQRHWFFVAVGFDQLIHYCCLLLTLDVVYYI